MLDLIIFLLFDRNNSEILQTLVNKGEGCCMAAPPSGRDVQLHAIYSDFMKYCFNQSWPCKFTN